MWECFVDIPGDHGRCGNVGASVSVAPTTTAAVTTTTTPTPTSGPTSATSTTVFVEECLRTLPFTLTYLPEGFKGQLRPGNGGEVAVEPEGTLRWTEPPSPAYVNYSGHAFRLGTFINIAIGVGEPALRYEPMTVLGRPAQFGDIEDGYLVVIHTGDSQCPEYSMTSYGVSSEDTRRVAGSLLPTPSTPQAR